MNNCANEVENYEEETNKIIDILNAHIKLIKQKEELIDALINENNQIIKENERLIKNISAFKNISESNNKSKYLYIFHGKDEFFSFAENLYNPTSWHIQDSPSKYRASSIKEYAYFKKLKNDFDKKELTNNEISDEQIISFLDTIHLMYRTFNKIQNETINKEVKIIMEYVIPDSRKYRIDYILAFRNSLLLIEFSGTTTFEKIKEINSHKNHQIIEYSNALDSLINNNNIIIKTKAFVYLPDTSPSFKEINQSSIKDLVKVIEKFFKSDNNKNSFETLLEIE